LAQMLAQGRLDVESYCSLIPFERFAEMETAFENFHEKQFRIGVSF